MSKKIKKIFIVVDSPFTKRDFCRYGINTFIKNDFQVKVLDMHCIIYETPILMNSSELCHDEVIVKIKSWDLLFKILKPVAKECVVYTTTLFQYKTYPLYRILSRLNITYIVNSVSVLPTLERKIDISLIERIFPIKLEKFCNLLLRKLPLKFSFVNPAFAIIIHGVKSNQNRKEVEKSTKIIYSHTFDYDLAFELGERIICPDGTAVFLDSYLPYHSDYNFYKSRKNTDLPRPLISKEYYSSLNVFYKKDLMKLIKNS